MGNLVFQATLGGQVNLVGPNTASTFNLNVPAVAGTLVTTGDTGTVTNTMCATSVYTAPGTIGSGTPNTGAFTTLSASSTTTLSGGTANGIAYLNGSKVVTTGSAITFDGTNFATTGTASATKLIPTGGSATGTGLYLPAANTLAWSNNGSETMRLDSSGNLGVGVTPSAWAGLSYKAIEVGAAGNALYGGANDFEISANAYYASGWKYGSNNPATVYVQYNGSHIWKNATSGTAGNAITFTQAMTLNASGNLLLGSTTNPSSSQVRQLNANTGSTFTQWTRTSSTIGGCYIGTEGSELIFGTHTGNVGAESYAERARIDSSGNLLVGITSVDATSATNCYIAPGYGYWYRNSTATQAVFNFRNPNGYVGSIQTSGSATAYNTSSDYRLKENVTPMTGALAVVSQLRPVNYTWKVDGTAGQGFIAHELAEIVPQCVSGEKDAVHEDGSIKPQGIDTSFLVATLTAAIQELKAEVDALKGTK